MPLIIPNTTVQDDYTDAVTFGGTDVFQGGYFTVANNPVACQMAVGQLGQAGWAFEQYLPPATYPIVPGGRIPVSGLRFKNFIAGSAAQVFGGLTYPGEPSIQAGTPYTQVVGSGGGVSPAPGAAMELIETQTRASTGTFDFINVPTTYAHLRLIMSLRGSNAGVLATVQLNFNGDAGLNYDYQSVSGSNVTASAGASVGIAGMFAGSVVGDTATANRTGPVVCDIPDYLSGFQKVVIGETARFQAAAAAGYAREAWAGLWRNTSAINRIQIQNASGGAWLAGSKVSLYGMTG